MLRLLVLFIISANGSAQTIKICPKEKLNHEGKVKANLLLWDKDFEEIDPVTFNCSNKDYPKNKILIKYRGSYSRHYDKKQFGFEFLDTKGKSLEVPFLGLKPHSKWTLHGGYVDRSLMRNAFAYALGDEFAKNRSQYFASKTKFVEVYLSEVYMGAYWLVEKIDIGENRVPLRKIDSGSVKNAPFILQVSPKDPNFKSKEKTDFEYVYPTVKKIEKIKKDSAIRAEFLKFHIEQDVNRFEAQLKSFSKSKTAPPKALINLQSFMDYFIIQEVAKNIDGFRRSVYLVRDNDGIFSVGPIWDFDLAFGNLSFYHMHEVTGWSHKRVWLSQPNVKWFEHLLKNPIFRRNLIEHYHFLRSENNQLSFQKIDNLINQLAQKMGDAPKRDFLKWKGSFNFLEKYVMNTRPMGYTNVQCLDILKNWIHQRLVWMDAHMEDL